MRATTLTRLTIWDGEETVDADAIRMEGGLITAVGPAAELAHGARVVPLPGGVAIPGLIDAHVHLVLDPDRATPPGRDEIPDPDALRGRARRMLAAGITTARDLGGGHWQELALRDQIRRGDCPGPRLLCAGQPLTSPGGHCHFWGGEAADGPAMLEVITRQLDAGTDLIKIMVTGGRMTPGSTPSATQFGFAELEAAVSSARAGGRPVAAHCHGTAGIEAATRAGVDTIEHCSWVGTGGWASDYRDDVARRIAAAGVSVSPTINSGWRRFLGGATGARMGEALRAMLDLEITLIASTDAGIPGVRHDDLPLALPVFARLLDADPAFVLKAATSTSADTLGIGAATGRIRPGLAADIVVVDGNPLASLDALAGPVRVYARGVELAAG